MTGKDLLLELGHISPKYYHEAETAAIPALVSRRILRRPLLVALLAALMLLLVGCGVAYVLRLQDLKMDERTQIVYVVDENHVVSQTTAVTQPVLTLAGLEGTAAHQAAQEWYDFKQAYDPDHSIITALQSAGQIPVFPDGYEAYNIYTQEMKEELDRIVEKYDLKLMGRKIPFRTPRQLCRGLGIGNVLLPGSSATMDITGGALYQCGNLRLEFDISLPASEGEAPVDTWGKIQYHRKDSFSEDSITIGEGALIGENYGTRQWNYTTKAGSNVLILRSASDWRSWIFCDQSEATVCVMVESRFETYSDDPAGNAVIEAVELTDRQLELLAENMDFSLLPQMDPETDLTGGAAGNGGTIGGYTVTLRSAVSDGHTGLVTLQITAPEGEILPDWESCRLVGINRGILLPVSADAKDVDIEHWLEAGDSSNCYNLVIRLQCGGDAPLEPEQVWNLYLEDLALEYYDVGSAETVTQLLVDGTWTFDLTFRGDDQELELVQEPVAMRTISGLIHQGNRLVPEYQEVTLHSFRLRAMSADIRYEPDVYADFAGSDEQILAVMKDGSAIALEEGPFAVRGSTELTAEAFIDLEQLDHILMADGSKLFPTDPER